MRGGGRGGGEGGRRQWWWNGRSQRGEGEGRDGRVSHVWQEIRSDLAPLPDAVFLQPLRSDRERAAPPTSETELTSSRAKSKQCLGDSEAGSPVPCRACFAHPLPTSCLSCTPPGRKRRKRRVGLRCQSPLETGSAGAAFEDSRLFGLEESLPDVAFLVAASGRAQLRGSGAGSGVRKA